MDISPATPPYEFHENNMKRYISPSIINSPANEPSSMESDNETTTTNNNNGNNSAFQRVSVSSPPELLLDLSEEEQDIDQNGLLWSVRQRFSMAKFSRPPSMKLLSIPQKRVRPMRIQIPRPHWSTPITTTSNTTDDDENDQRQWYLATKKPIMNTQSRHLIQKKAYKRKTSHTTSGRPTRVKGPCQACQETSDGCMRKAFNWPFPTNQTFNDKGKPFVYLCNKCGLRYNKSGGCVCRNCRWVLCKEEKRKAMQLIHLMRSRRPDGKVDPEENIENFTCTPKYWSCCHPWKVGWILNSQHDVEDDDD